MSNISKEKKMQVLKVPKITNTARKIAKQKKEKEITVPRKMNKRLSKTAGLDRAIISKFAIYIGIAVVVAFIKILAVNSVSTLDRQYKAKDRELRRQVSTLENKFYDGIDRKKLEKKAYEDGFVPNNPIRYIKVEDKK